ncbi:hypothetical protein CWC48_00670 [Pseudomonas sp. S10E 269]|nr:hypothetical protein CWC49_10830 [Pseudomonas sp. S09F 262]PJK37699.1 hypothetical protein CWC48_00670 [Pseudomonas sp. S10E 269]
MRTIVGEELALAGMLQEGILGGMALQWSVIDDDVDQQCTAMIFYVLFDRPKQNPICFRKWGFGI